ncbi:galactose-1-phosphate uridylyltransferase [Enterococcus faecalis EnGen0118]|nr:galactose-1-phosphate uridylyltransferase [Enterococcus faecalis EnGen0118]
MTTSQMIADFTTLAIQAGGWMELDRLYLQNRLLSMIGEQELGEVDIRPVATPAADLAEQLCQVASANQLVKTEQQKEQFMVQLMDLLTPPPSVVNAFFAQHYAKEPQEATEYFYQLCQKNGTVIEQEEPVVFSTVYGDFLANKVHSEASKATLSAQSYPRCEWCMATEGYQGSQQFPATTNHRVIRMNLDGESWGFSFVKQAQYQQQGVIAFEKHQSAKRSIKTFQQLLKIVEVFPHYLAGIDADFEQNEHVYYQTGLQQFPLAEASISEYVELANYPLINAGMVNWPVATFRLEGPNASEVAQAANDIFEQWQTLKLPTDEIQIVARRKELLYVMDLIFSRPQAKPSLTLAEVQGLTTWNNQKTQALETVASAYQQRLKEASAFAETSEGKAAFLAMVAPVTH